MTTKYPDAPACPFCGSADLADSDWLDAEGTGDAITCKACLAGAPAGIWCGPRHCDIAPDKGEEALNMLRQWLAKR